MNSWCGVHYIIFSVFIPFVLYIHVCIYIYIYIHVLFQTTLILIFSVYIYIYFLSIFFPRKLEFMLNGNTRPTDSWNGWNCQSLHPDFISGWVLRQWKGYRCGWVDDDPMTEHWGGLSENGDTPKLEILWGTSDLNFGAPDFEMLPSGNLTWLALGNP